MKSLIQKIIAKFMNISFQKKFFVVTIIPAVLGLFIQGTILFQTSANIIRDDSIRTNQWLINDLTENIYGFFRKFEDRMVEIYRYNDQIYLLSSGNITDFNISIFAQKIYLEHFGFGDYIRGIYIYNNKKELASSYTPIRDYKYASDIFADDPNLYYVLMEYFYNNNGNTFIGSYYNTDLNKNIIRMAYLIKNIYTHEYYGMLIIDFDDTALLEILKKYKNHEDQIFRLERANNIILTTTMQEERGSNNVMVLESKIKKFDIDLITEFPLESIKYALANTRTTIILLIVMSISIILVLSYFLSNIITKPIKKIVETMKIVESGDISVRTDMDYNDELGRLGNSFNVMLDKLNDLILREKKAMFYKNDAEIKALQAQVNPHFLYNTLQTMSSIAYAEKSIRVSTICNVLADLFRYSINSESNYATIKEEIIHLKNYVYVQNARFNNAIRLRIYCDNNMYNIRIPRLTLQPLVENAIIHGLKGKGGRGSVRIGIRKKTDKAYIYIADNGSGIDEIKLEDINNRMKANNSILKKESKGSIGLDSINQRLKNIYGDEHRLKVLSKKDKITIIKFSVPL